MSRMSEMYAEQGHAEQMEYEAEMHYKTLQILEYLSEVLKEEDFSLMCYHCGVDSKLFKKEQS